jgi:ankyrin repeat protein
MGRIEIARVLLEFGASVDVGDKRGRTPLDVASEEGHDEIIQLLMEHGAVR